MAFEDPCIIYVGASGAVFGFIGLAIAGVRTLIDGSTVAALPFACACKTNLHTHAHVRALHTQCRIFKPCTFLITNTTTYTCLPSDLLLNWDSIKAPIVRLVIMLATLGLTIAVEYIELPYMRLGSG